MLSGIAFAQDISVDSDVMRGGKSPSYVEYSGSYESGEMATGSQIRETGRSLGRIIHAHEDDETPFAKGNPAYKYSAGRVYGKDKAGADILYLGESVGVNTIKCLRLIVSGYVQEAFSCSQTESDLIAVAVCDWNANHYLDSAYFEKRYDLRVFSLFADLCNDIGLSTDYHEWPNSRIVIPHQSAGSALMNSSFVAEVLASEEKSFSEDGDNLLSDDSENGVVESATELLPQTETDADNVLRNAGFKNEKHKKKWPWWLLLLILILIVIFFLIRFLNNGESEHISVEKGFSFSNTAPNHEAKIYGQKAKKSADGICGSAVKTAALYFSCSEDSVNKDCIAENTAESKNDADNGKDEKIHFYTTKEERMENIPRETDKYGRPRGTWSGEPGNSMFIPADTPENQEIKKYLHEHGVEGIVYKDGVPDFSPVSEGTVEIPDMTEYRYSQEDLNIINI